VAPAKTLEKSKYTTLGSARKTVDLKKRFPKTTALSLDFYLLSRPLQVLLTCNDPEVNSDEQYLKATRSTCLTRPQTPTSFDWENCERLY
jgi:hypothetical protein